MDPYIILNVSDSANDETIKAAYLESVRHYPPEKNALMFECIRTAYETIATQQQRLKYRLFLESKPALDTVMFALLKNSQSDQPNKDVTRSFSTMAVHAAIVMAKKNVEQLC
ncbi:MAG: hypothetical protein A3F13_06730 [Gammaproteobacteria bacterium RIFCSPHIGHO2_12_FULL_40_19]|nr:MAG: hypothetical protein A3F13_06730 [Gammaproteobacteria bacterium RIFCSPHIGHO2_12_FULL_40_19]